MSRHTKCLVTHVTFVWFVSTVNSAVCNKVTWYCKSFATYSTFKWFLSWMNSPVYCQCLVVLTIFTTFCALVLTCMNIHMGTQTTLIWKTLPTIVTRIQLFSSVSFYVRCHSFLCCKHCRGCTEKLLCWVMPSSLNFQTVFIKGAPCIGKTQTNIER